jgi:hypothetical protein
MAELEFNVIPKKILYKCDECKDGWLMYTGKLKEGINGKPLFLHQCQKCKRMFDLKKQYPSLKFNGVKELLINAN